MTRKEIRDLPHNSKDFVLTSADDMAILADETSWLADRARSIRKAREAAAKKNGLMTYDTVS